MWRVLVIFQFVLTIGGELQRAVDHDGGSQQVAAAVDAYPVDAGGLNAAEHIAAGTALQGSRRTEEAAAAFARAIAMDPTQLMARVRLGQLLQAQGRYRDALSHFGAALRDAPSPAARQQLREAAAASVGPGGAHSAERALARLHAEVQRLTPAGKTPIAMHLEVNPTHGWGNFALNTLLVLGADNSGAGNGNALPFMAWMMQPPNERALSLSYPLKSRFLRARAAQAAAVEHATALRLARLLDGSGGSRPTEKLLGFPALHGVANFETLAAGAVWSSSSNVAVCFLERSSLSAREVRNAAAFDMVLTGSEWNTATLRRHGLRRVATVRQGVDTHLFARAAAVQQDGRRLLARPQNSGTKGGVAAVAPGAAMDLTGRFVIFSGGKLERRKGQDILVAAFRRFVVTHPESILVTAWHNYWPATMESVAQAGLVDGWPDVVDEGGDTKSDSDAVRPQRQRIEVAAWLKRNGVAARHVLDLCEVTHVEIAAALRVADVAVFPNRAEGGTNLVAMEAMASGVPVVISNNTGHRDIAGEGHCYPLRRQTLTSESEGGVEAGWGESSVDELLELLERVKARPEEARKRGDAAARFIRARYSWPAAIKHMAGLLQQAGLASGEAPVTE